MTDGPKVRPTTGGDLAYAAALEQINTLRLKVEALELENGRLHRTIQGLRAPGDRRESLDRRYHDAPVTVERRRVWMEDPPGGLQE